MRSAAETGRLARIGLLVSLAAAVHLLETLVPTPVPWFRLGLGNALVLLALHLYGGREALWVGLGKVVVGSLLAGRFLSPGFALSLGGTVAATGVMAAAIRLPLPLGFVGLSVLGAEAHALTQIALASSLFLRTSSLWSLAPLLGGLAVGSGALTGLLAHRLALSLDFKD